MKCLGRESPLGGQVFVDRTSFILSPDIEVTHVQEDRSPIGKLSSFIKKDEKKTKTKSCVFTANLVAMKLGDCKRPVRICMARGVSCVIDGVVYNSESGVTCEMKDNGNCPEALECLEDKMEKLNPRALEIRNLAKIAPEGQTKQSAK